jgi:hypothetical protein
MGTPASPQDDSVTGAALARVDTLETRGDLVGALDALVEAAALERTPMLERRLVRLRQAAFSCLDRTPVAWPAERFARIEPAPPGGFEVPAATFTGHTLATGLLRHGHVLVRGLLPEERVASLRHAIDRTFEAHDEAARTGPTVAMQPWCDPIEGIADLDPHRLMARASAGVLAADSPRAFCELLDAIRSLGLDRMIADYFGERPALSVKKCTLRRLRLRDWRVSWRLWFANWHQDGAFLGRGIRSVNAWFALSRCGRDAPGMELVPMRLERLLATGDAGANFDWTVSRRTIARALPDVAVWAPEFQAGDVLFFDHWFLHRTAPKLGQWRRRYAIETWFFAPSVYADRPETALLV